MNNDLDKKNELETNQRKLKIFEDIFRRNYFGYPKEAANYFLALIEHNFGCTLKNFIKECDMSYQKLTNGRKELLKYGYIARVINFEDSTLPEQGELYLPVNPKLIWEMVKSEQIRNFEEEEIRINSELINGIADVYEKNFLKSGLAISEGSISIHYSGRWLFYTLFNNSQSSQRLRMMLGRLGSFKGPYTNFYESMFSLHKGLSLEILYSYPKNSMSREEQAQFEARVKNLEYLKKTYPNNIEFYASLVPHATTRRILFDTVDKSPYLAIDARKILPINRKDPSYLGTVYFEKEDTIWLEENFEESWKNTVKHYKRKK